MGEGNKHFDVNKVCSLKISRVKTLNINYFDYCKLNNNTTNTKHEF